MVLAQADFGFERGVTARAPADCRARQESRPDVVRILLALPWRQVPAFPGGVVLTPLTGVSLTRRNEGCILVIGASAPMQEARSAAPDASPTTGRVRHYPGQEMRRSRSQMSAAAAEKLTGHAPRLGPDPIDRPGLARRQPRRRPGRHRRVLTTREAIRIGNPS